MTVINSLITNYHHHNLSMLNQVGFLIHLNLVAVVHLYSFICHHYKLVNLYFGVFIVIQLLEFQ